MNQIMANEKMYKKEMMNNTFNFLNIHISKYKCHSKYVKHTAHPIESIICKDAFENHQGN